MYFIQFYTKSAISDDIVEACGDRSVLVVDGRRNDGYYSVVAEEWARRHESQGFTHYALFHGDTFSRAQQVIERRLVPASYGDKRDYPKIDIYVDGAYAGSTTWSRTCREAKARYIERNKTNGKVTAVFSK